MLQGGTTDLSQHVGHQVEVTGTLAQGGSQASGATSGSSASGSSSQSADSQARGGSSTSGVGTSGTAGGQMLRVTSVRTISTSCDR